MVPVDLAARVDSAAAEANFSGVVRVDIEGENVLASAFGDANRALRSPNRPDTLMAMASGSKLFTSCVVLSLMQEGIVDIDRPVRHWLGTDLTEIADDVTLRHLLTHRSGIGDYLDEDELEITDYVLPEPTHIYTTTESFVPALEGHPTVFAAGERFRYCNGGFVVAALVAERASGVGFHSLVEERVFTPAGLTETAYLRTDSLGGRVAVGYLFGPEADDALRTNALHLPVRGNGDGGAFTTTLEMAQFWRALVGGRILEPPTVELMRTPTTEAGDTGGIFGFGLGMWIYQDAMVAEGADAGVGFRGFHYPDRQVTWTVASNVSDGAWPVALVLREAFD